MDTPKKIGRYEILEELGHGAMGTVYRAKDPAMDRIVALKTIISLVLASEQGSEFRERFYREARAAGGMAHPGIVAVFDVGEHEGLPFLVMEFINGRTLADAVKRGERLSLDRVCEIGQKIVEALGYAHQRGVVHRDIKPANILLTSREAHGIERPKITDFGVAKLAAGQTTLTGQILGTPAYMPPEQFTGASIDGRADIFSLGVVLYWMATGEQPFPGESMTAVSYKVVHTEPVPPRKLNPSIPARLEALILKCLAKNPDERYQTGDELARDLGEIRAGGRGKGNTLQTAAPQTANAGNDADATLIEVPLASSATARTMSPQSVSATAPAVAAKSKTSGALVLAGVATAVVLAGGWYVLRNRAKPTVQETAVIAPAPGTPLAAAPAPASADAVASNETAESTPPAPAAPVRDTLAATKPTENAAAKKPDANAAAKKAEAKADTGAPAKVAPPAGLPAPIATPAVAAPAAVDFNPKSLDPKENTKLKIDAGQMPTGLDFTVEMNGKVYLDSGAEGHKAQYDNLFVPPGVQEFRVTARSGAVQKASNIVSSEFKAKKRSTLKIELRTQGAPSGAGVPQDLYADTQIVVTLK